MQRNWGEQQEHNAERQCSILCSKGFNREELVELLSEAGVSFLSRDMTLGSVPRVDLLPAKKTGC